MSQGRFSDARWARVLRKNGKSDRALRAWASEVLAAIETEQYMGVPIDAPVFEWIERLRWISRECPLAD
jgi:hypothetical protein